MDLVVKRANRNPALLHPALLYGWQLTEAAFAMIGRPVMLTETARSHARQAELYAQGRTAPGKKVTNARAGQSDHHPHPDGFAWALDYAFRSGRSPSWLESHPWEAVARYFCAIVLPAQYAKLELKAGADWRKPDRPHLYLTKRLPRTVRT